MVVENVERNIALGASPKAATYKAMDEVSKPIIAITLTLASVFVPLAFMPGLTGQFYQQFALTIAISTILSAFNSLTLSPALCALLLKPHDAPKDRLSRILDRVLGPLFNGFNRLSARGEHAYGSKLRRVIQRKGMTLGLYAVLLGFTAWLGNALPGGFVPAQDKEFLVGLAQLPSGASLDRTEQVIQRMNDIALKQPGVAHTLEFPGMSVNGLMNSSSAGIIFVILEPFASRQGAQMSATDIAASLNQQFAGIKEAFTGVFPPPPVLGLGTLGGFKLQFEDRGALGFEALNDAVRAFLKEAAQAPELAASFSSYQIDVPQLKVDLDRIKAKQSKVAMTDVFDTLQIYLGSLYVNDFNLLGRVYQVRVQADAPFQKRDPDRRVRPRAGTPGPQHCAVCHRGQPVAPAPDPDDVYRFHHGRGAAGAVHRCRRGNALRHGHCRVLRHAGGHPVRAVAYAGVLCRALLATRGKRARTPGFPPGIADTPVR